MPVNGKGSVRACVLEVLRNSSSPVSGEAMAESLGVSRVAVWKAIRTLVDSGYGISAAPAGYRLDRDRTDGVFPWEFPSDEALIKYLAETSSTMDAARTEALAGCEHGLIVLADRQTDGRGTGGRKWESFDGALFFTMVTRPAVNPAYAHRETLRAQLAMADAIESVARERAVPQWPNDVYVPGGKACGILGETLSVGATVSYLNLGIGVNTAGIAYGAPDRARDARGGAGNGIAFVESGRQELLKAFRDRFGKTEKNGADEYGQGDGLVRSWNARCPLVGKTVSYRVGDAPETAARERARGAAATDGGDSRVERATFAGVDRAGWAIMQDDTERSYPPGSITILDKGTHR